MHRIPARGEYINYRSVKAADYVIDLGPEGGEEGGSIIVQGTTDEITKVSEFYTGQFLKNV